MKVYVKTAGCHLDTLEGAKKNGWCEIETKEQEKLDDVLSGLGVGSEEGFAYMLNGNYAKGNTRLHEGDEILLMRMLYGG